MRIVRGRWLLLVLGVALAGLAVLLPSRARTLDDAGAIGAPVRGTIHVHTRRSDGSGTIDDVAAAAARAGLRFVVFSDHGDATRTPQRPAYRHGVLCIDAIEVATFAGHVLAIGLQGEAPYPLGGEPRDVIDDVARLGGMSVAAHPTSAKPALRWQDWSSRFDGLEWLNADSEWRDERPLTLLAALLTYPFRRAETLTSLLDRPGDVLARWDQLLRTRRVVGLAGADAHASMVNGEDNPYSDRSPIALPAYEQSFRTFSVAVPDVHLSGEAAADARLVVDAVRSGDLYTSIEGLAHPARLSFVARSGAEQAHSGQVLRVGGPVTLDVHTNAPAGARIVLIHDGQRAADANGSSLTYRTDSTSGFYRAEVYLRAKDAGNAVPWIVSNPIYLGEPAGASPPPFVASKESVLYRDGILGDVHGASAGASAASPADTWPSGWGIEASDKSRGVLDLARVNNEVRLVLQYTLGGTKDDSPWVALGTPAGADLPSFDHLTFRGRANRPMRIWVQFWRPVPTGNEYWRRSVYLDPVERDIVIPYSELVPSNATTPRVVPLTAIVSVQFVVDGVHTPLGESGQFWIGNVRYQR